MHDEKYSWQFWTCYLFSCALAEFFTKYVMIVIGYSIFVTREIIAEGKNIIFKVNE
ncbi:hypothetical protein psyc5s11_38490 [Clostridium gelidum]|uniref:Uncharacterized protein n=1 Tax=Clostridium gelidum TaxID=704125 RepID=A0ABM7T6Z9_9CLOT|nr:hypothetical protein psyc5s11_38490 [Clostridium gelidum]